MSLLIMDLMNIGQLGCVKLVPMPPSKDFGKGELESVGALSIDVATALEVVFVALASGAALLLASARRCSAGSGDGLASNSISPILPTALDLRIRDPGWRVASVGAQSRKNTRAVKARVWIALKGRR